VDATVKDRLRLRAARNRRSREAPLRAIVTEIAGTEGPSEVNLAEAIRRRFAPLGGVELALPPREPACPPLRGNHHGSPLCRQTHQ